MDDNEKPAPPAGESVRAYAARKQLKPTQIAALLGRTGWKLETLKPADEIDAALELAWKGGL